jgi:post-segregation antitoxin (ccd killing protein)
MRRYTVRCTAVREGLMAKTSVYLPDDLAEQARARGIPISEVAQAAVRRAVKEAQLKEEVMTDIQAVAERLRETQRQAAERSRLEDMRVHSKGAEWARAYAIAPDLEYVATFYGQRDDFRPPSGPLALPFGPGWDGMPDGPGQDRWEQFQAGAREVWEAVKPLLVESGGATPGIGDPLQRPLVSGLGFTRPLDRH